MYSLVIHNRYFHNIINISFFLILLIFLNSFFNIPSASFTTISGIIIFLIIIMIIDIKINLKGNNNLLETHTYYNATRILLLTKKIEKHLELLGGKGKGMYEKAESINHPLLNEILRIAEIRNEVVHGNHYVKDINKTLQEIEKVLNLLQEQNLLQKKHNYMFFVLFAVRFIFILILILISLILYNRFGIGPSIGILILIPYIIEYTLSILILSGISIFTYIVRNEVEFTENSFNLIITLLNTHLGWL